MIKMKESQYMKINKKELNILLNNINGNMKNYNEYTVHGHLYILFQLKKFKNFKFC